MCQHDTAAGSGEVSIDDSRSSSSSSSSEAHARASCYTKNDPNNRCMNCVCSMSLSLSLSTHHPYEQEVVSQVQSQSLLQSFTSSDTSSRPCTSSSPPYPTGERDLDAAVAAAASASAFASLLPTATAAVAAVPSPSSSSSQGEHWNLQKDLDDERKRTQEEKKRPPCNVRFSPSIEVVEIERYTTDDEKNARWYTTEEMGAFRTKSKRLIKEMSRHYNRRTDEELFELWGILSKDTVRAKKKSIRVVQNCVKLLNVIKQNQKETKERKQDTKTNEDDEDLPSSSSSSGTSTRARSMDDELTVVAATTKTETGPDATKTLAATLLSSSSVISSVFNEDKVAKQLLLCAYSLESNACAERAKSFALMVQKNQISPPPSPPLLFPSSSSHLEKMEKKKRRKQQKRKQHGRHSVWKKEKIDENIQVGCDDLNVPIIKKKKKITNTATIDHLDIDMRVATRDTKTNSKLVVIYS